MKESVILHCAACGRIVTNDVAEPNAASWTHDGDPRLPYCADSDACRRDAESLVIETAGES